MAPDSSVNLPLRRRPWLGGSKAVEINLTYPDRISYCPGSRAKRLCSLNGKVVVGNLTVADSFERDRGPQALIVACWRQDVNHPAISLTIIVPRPLTQASSLDPVTGMREGADWQDVHHLVTPQTSSLSRALTQAPSLDAGRRIGESAGRRDVHHPVTTQAFIVHRALTQASSPDDGAGMAEESLEVGCAQTAIGFETLGATRQARPGVYRATSQASDARDVRPRIGVPGGETHSWTFTGCSAETSCSRTARS